jgi:hypothetical protein
MSDIALNYLGQTGDLDLTGHRLSLVTGEAAMEQQLKIRFRFVEGTWFLSLLEGLPYLSDILIKSPDLLLVESLFREAIESTPGITTVNTINVTVDATRKLTLTFSATMDTGETLVFSPFVIEI